MGATIRVVLMTIVAIAIVCAALSVFGIEDRGAAVAASSSDAINTGLFVVEGVPEREIVKEALVNGTADQVFAAWTTPEGIKGFLGVDSTVDLKVGGAYEIYFDADAPEGTRGGEGCQILSYVPGEMLSFSLNAPAQFPEERGRRTWVTVRLSQRDAQTRVRVIHTGFGEGGHWDDVYAHFDGEWDRVMRALEAWFAGRR
jgi:uncharacterized protein YndB with AHSA1/START domain